MPSSCDFIVEMSEPSELSSSGEILSMHTESDTGSRDYKEPPVSTDIMDLIVPGYSDTC
jgi:hypothetical protein